MSRSKTIRRVREQMDTELALTNDLYQAAMKLAVECGWRVAVRQVFYVASRLGGSHGRKAYVEFLQNDEAWR